MSTANANVVVSPDVFVPTFTDTIANTNIDTVTVNPTGSSSLASIETFTEIFRSYVALAQLDVDNVIGALSLQNQITALSTLASSQMWVDYRTIGETSYYLRLGYLQNIFTNQVGSLNLTTNVIMTQFFTYYNNLVAKFQGEVDHVADYIQNAYTAAASQFSNVANVESFVTGNVSYSVSSLANVTSNIVATSTTTF